MFRMITIAFFLLALSSFAGNPPVTDSKNPDPSAESCDLCSNEGWIACLKCEGEGSYKVVCYHCLGKRKLTCPYIRCRGSGRFDCPVEACWGGGKIHWKGGDTDDCKICTKGKVTCWFCEGAKEVDCPTCGKKGKIERACRACFGHGGFPCPQCKSPKPCPACRNSKRMTCFQCLGEGRFPVECDKCVGFGFCPCSSTCVGGRKICRECTGSGVVRFVSGGRKAGKRKCPKCKGRGWEKCKICHGKGKRACPPVAEYESCSECKGEGGIPCEVCGESK